MLTRSDEMVGMSEEIEVALLELTWLVVKMCWLSQPWAPLTRIFGTSLLPSSCYMLHLVPGPIHVCFLLQKYDNINTQCIYKFHSTSA
jgi:hypothetical protein